MKKTIKLVGVESDLKKITLLEDGGRVNKDGEPKYEKYKIWMTKKDGNQTKAYTQFQAINPRAGDSFDLEVAEEEKEFNGFKYMDRTVMFFYTQDNTPVAPQTHQNAPQAPIAPQVDNQHQVAQRAFIAELVDRVKKLETEQISLHKRICHLEDKDKPDYVPPTEEAKINDEIDVESIPF